MTSRRLPLAISNPLLINLITNALVFVVLLYSPIVVPASHFPGVAAGR